MLYTAQTMHCTISVLNPCALDWEVLVVRHPMWKHMTQQFIKSVSSLTIILSQQAPAMGTCSGCVNVDSQLWLFQNCLMLSSYVQCVPFMTECTQNWTPPQSFDTSLIYDGYESQTMFSSVVTLKCLSSLVTHSWMYFCHAATWLLAVCSASTQPLGSASLEVTTLVMHVTLWALPKLH